MSMLSYFAAAIAGANFASAATCSVAGTTTIKDQTSAAALAGSCQTFTGTIAISSSNTDPIDLTGIEIIKNGGIFAANNPNLQSLSAPDLTTLDNSKLWLDNVTQLSGLSFPMLTSVDVLHFNSLASLYGWTLTSGISTAGSVLISDTLVADLTGINLKTVDTLSINNNNLLSSIDMQLGKITGGVVISQNGHTPSVSFPDLIYAVNMTFTGVSSLDLSNLKSVNQTLGVYESQISTFSAPKLSTAGGLALVNNPNLNNISVPALSVLEGALTVVNDTSLGGTVAFPKLTQVRGAVKVAGSFTSISMPSLTNVRGAFTILSSKKLGNSCNRFDTLASNKEIQGLYTCGGSTPTPTPGASSTASGSSSSTSTGAAAAIDRATPVMGGFLGLCLAILGML